MTAHGDVQVRALCAGSSECQSGVCAALCVQVGVHIRRGVEWQVGCGPGLGAGVCAGIMAPAVRLFPEAARATGWL